MTGRRSVIAAASERQFQAMVVELAHLLGYRTYHTWLSVRSAAGWPDLAIWKPGRFILAELKSDRGRLSEQQREVIESLKQAGVEVYVWRPSEFDAIADILRGTARPPVEAGDSAGGQE